MRRRGKDRYGISTANPPVPVGIDDYTGFKVPLSSLRKDWAGLMTVDPDVRNFQDFVRGVKDRQNLPYARPEAPDIFVALPLLWENGVIMTTQSGSGVLLGAGIDAADTL